MCRKIFFFSFLLGCATLGVDRCGATSGRPENRALEDAIMEGFEALRKLMKEGAPELEIPPMEPLLVPRLHFDFYLRDTELRGYFRDAVVRNLSDFRIRNVTLNLSRGIEFSLEAFFELLDLNGDFSLEGLLFGELPVLGTGEFRVGARGVNASLSGELQTKAGLLQLKDIRLDFGISRIAVVYTNWLVDEEMRQIPEEFALELLDRFRERYLHLLLKTLKTIVNDFIERLDLWQELGTLLTRRRHAPGWSTQNAGGNPPPPQAGFTSPGLGGRGERSSESDEYITYPPHAMVVQANEM